MGFLQAGYIEIWGFGSQDLRLRVSDRGFTVFVFRFGRVLKHSWVHRGVSAGLWSLSHGL